MTKWNIGARREPPERSTRRFHAGERVYVLSMSLFGNDRHFGSVVTGNESTRLWEGIGRGPGAGEWSSGKPKKEPHVLVRLDDDGERYWLPSADLFPANEGNENSAGDDSNLVARYLTKSGLVGLEIRRMGPSSYGYSGKWGAGSGGGLMEVRKRVLSTIAHHKGWRLEYASPEWSSLDAMNSAGGAKSKVPGTVQVFLAVLSSKLVQWDQAEERRALKRRGGIHNIYGLGLTLEALHKVEDRMKAMGIDEKRSDPEAIGALAKVMSEEFFPDFPPVKATLKQMGAWVERGKSPSLIHGGGAERYLL